MNHPSNNPADAPLVIGVMAGSSRDGLDVAACRFWQASTGEQRWQWRIERAATLPYTPGWDKHLQRLPEASAAELAKAHTDYGHLLGMELRRWCVQESLSPALVSVHGHTVFHRPQTEHFTWQLGSGEVIASHLPAPVVTDLRTKDVALGGEGAPLVPFAERHLFPRTQAFLNLGGIANLSLRGDLFDPADFPSPGCWLRKPPAVLAFDLAPCNQLLNRLAAAHDPALRHDPEGELARSGERLPALEGSLLELPYHHLPAPKSLGNEDVWADFWPRIEAAEGRPVDKLRSLVEVLAVLHRQALEQLSARPASILLTGGGAYNRYLVERLAEAVRPLGVELDIPAAELIDNKEALAWAFLGLLRWRGEVNHLPAATGSRRATVLGSLHVPAGKPILT